MLGRRVPIIAISLAAVCVLATPSVAAAQVIFVDPGSPAGQEYSVPFDTARQNAAGNTDYNAAPGQDPGPPFGVGVKPDTEGSAGFGGTAGGGGGDGSDGGGDGSATDSKASDGGGARLPELSSSADRGGLDAQVLALAAGAVLLALGTGLGLRRIPGV
jgi:hypothetical protein